MLVPPFISVPPDNESSYDLSFVVRTNRKGHGRLVTAQNETSESRKPLPHLTCENSLRSHPPVLRGSQGAPVKSRASAPRKSFLYRYFSATRSGKPLLVPDKPSSGESEPEASVFAKLPTHHP